MSEMSESFTSSGEDEAQVARVSRVFAHGINWGGITRWSFRGRKLTNHNRHWAFSKYPQMGGRTYSVSA